MLRVKTWTDSGWRSTRGGGREWCLILKEKAESRGSPKDNMEKKKMWGSASGPGDHIRGIQTERSPPTWLGKNRGEGGSPQTLKVDKTEILTNTSQEWIFASLIGCEKSSVGKCNHGSKLPEKSWRREAGQQRNCWGIKEQRALIRLSQTRSREETPKRCFLSTSPRQKKQEDELGFNWQ